MLVLVYPQTFALPITKAYPEAVDHKLIGQFCKYRLGGLSPIHTAGHIGGKAIHFKPTPLFFVTLVT